MPDPEHPDPEIVDFAPNPARTRLLIAIAIAIAIAAVAVAGVAAAMIFVVIKPGAPAADRRPARHRLHPYRQILASR
jgi:hypothetical protein